MRLVHGHPRPRPSTACPSWRPHVEFGVSPRATLGLVAAGRALALLRGRDYVLPDDVVDVAADVMCHRLVLTFDALADGVDPRDLIRPHPRARCRRRGSHRSRTTWPRRTRRDAAPPASPGVAEPPSALPVRGPTPCVRRLDGLLHGEHRGLRPGPGSEPADRPRRTCPGRTTSAGWTGR